MFYIIETEKQLSRLEDMGHLGCFADIITTSDNFHPALSKVVALYIRPFDEYVDPETQEPRGYNHGYIIPIDHNEGLCVSEDRAFSVLNKSAGVKLNIPAIMFEGNTCNFVLYIVTLSL